MWSGSDLIWHTWLTGRPDVVQKCGSKSRNMGEGDPRVLSCGCLCTLRFGCHSNMLHEIGNRKVARRSTCCLHSAHYMGQVVANFEAQRQLLVCIPPPAAAVHAAAAAAALHPVSYSGYCGSLQPQELPPGTTTQALLVVPVDRRYPMIR